MTLHLVGVAMAVLVGLFATHAMDYVDSAGTTHPLGWLVFAAALGLVARDAVLGGSFRLRQGGPRREDLPRLSVDRGDPRVRIRLAQFEPVATTTAILSGLLASGAIDFSGADGGTTAWGWSVFGLALFLALGGRLAPRPRRKRKGKRLRDSIEAEFSAFFDTIEGEFRKVRDDPARGTREDDGPRPPGEPPPPPPPPPPPRWGA